MDWGHMLNVEGWVWAQEYYARVYMITLKTYACKRKKKSINSTVAWVKWIK